MSIEKVYEVEETVGQKFKGWDGRIYLCESYDPRKGFWMVTTEGGGRRTNVSERAIGSTFHRVQ